MSVFHRYLVHEKYAVGPFAAAERSPNDQDYKTKGTAPYSSFDFFSSFLQCFCYLVFIFFSSYFVSFFIDSRLSLVTRTW